MVRSDLAPAAVLAVDAALWDLKVTFLNPPWPWPIRFIRNGVRVYGCSGFIGYDDHQLCEQHFGWVENEGCCWVKMKVGANPNPGPAGMGAAGLPSPTRRFPGLGLDLKTVDVEPFAAA